jgi:gliding motility associated protien GldN
MKFWKIVFLGGIVCGPLLSLGQQQQASKTIENLPQDGYFSKSDLQNRKVIPYAPIRPADVAYVKRIWREIDLREKMNAIYTSPKSNLIQIIMEAVLAGELTAYDPTPSEGDPNGDGLRLILAADQVMSRFGGDSTLVEQYDAEGNVISSHFEQASFDPAQVVRFRIKEDWIFDKQRGIFEPRIVAIAPLVSPSLRFMQSDQMVDADMALTDPTGMSSPNVNIDPYPAFWIDFQEARHILIHKEVVNRNNDATGLSYDDVFIKRLFSSYIVKQSNPEDLRIKDYISDPMERLLESERIKKMLIDFEQDLWVY